MDDYYEIVGVERTAPRDAVDRKIREQMRLWQRRTANADLDRRQEAERRVRQLGEARATLLDDEKRRRYDRQLTAYRSSDPPPLPSSTGATAGGDATGGGATRGGATSGTAATGDWLTQARNYLAENDHQSAAYAARETLRTAPNPPPEVWTILARANTALGRLEDALFEARRAVRSDPGSPDAHLALAHVHEQREEWREAGSAYETAGRLDPQAEAPRLGQAVALVRAGRASEAITHLERRYAETTNRAYAGRWLAQALVKAAEAVAQVPGSSGYRITSQTQVGQMRRMLNRAREVTSDPQILRTVAELERYLAGRDGPRYDRLRRHESRPTARAAPAAPPVPGPGQQPNVLAIVSLVLALACFTAPVGAVIGHVARAQIRERGQQGDGLALTGITVGWLLTALGCCGVFAYLNNGVLG